MAEHPGMQADLNTSTTPGQDAFGAIQEVVRILDADAKTNWSTVRLEAIRQDLIDMNEVPFGGRCHRRAAHNKETTGNDPERGPPPLLI
jgi:hypothetical protein